MKYDKLTSKNRILIAKSMKHTSSFLWKNCLPAQIAFNNVYKNNPNRLYHTEYF